VRTSISVLQRKKTTHFFFSSLSLIDLLYHLLNPLCLTCKLLVSSSTLSLSISFLSLSLSLLPEIEKESKIVIYIKSPKEKGLIKNIIAFTCRPGN
jgi:hypothetical protein